MTSLELEVNSEKKNGAAGIDLHAAEPAGTASLLKNLSPARAVDRKDRAARKNCQLLDWHQLNAPIDGANWSIEMSDWSMTIPITEQEVGAELSAANLVGGSDIDDALNWVQAAEVGMEVQIIADHNNQLWEYLYLKTTDGWVYQYRQLDQED